MLAAFTGTTSANDLEDIDEGEKKEPSDHRWQALIWKSDKNACESVLPQGCWHSAWPQKMEDSNVSGLRLKQKHRARREKEFLQMSLHHARSASFLV
jgi:hypothetical protein